jgi:tetratricopeptide (TPR) repeat protein
LHDQHRAYAEELLHEIDGESEQHAALTRLLDHLLHTAHAASTLLYPGQDRIEPPPPHPGTTVDAPAGVQAALGWLSREHATLLAAIRAAANAGLDTHSWRLAGALADFLQRRGYWHDWLAALRAGLAAARRQGAREAQARLHRDLGFACSMTDRYDEARDHLTRALELYQQTGDNAGRAATHLAFGSLLVRMSRFEEALDEDRRALALFRAAGHTAGQARTLNNTAWKHVKLGRYDEALDFGSHALTLHSAAGNPRGQADTWDTLGYLHHHRGKHDDAVKCYERALELFRSRGDRYYEADTLQRLGDALHAAGDLAGADRARQHHAAILRQINAP